MSIVLYTQMLSVHQLWFHQFYRYTLPIFPVPLYHLQTVTLQNVSIRLHSLYWLPLKLPAGLHTNCSLVIVILGLTIALLKKHSLWCSSKPRASRLWSRARTVDPAKICPGATSLIRPHWRCLLLPALYFPVVSPGTKNLSTKSH